MANGTTFNVQVLEERLSRWTHNADLDADRLAKEMARMAMFTALEVIDTMIKAFATSQEEMSRAGYADVVQWRKNWLDAIEDIGLGLSNSLKTWDDIPFCDEQLGEKYDHEQTVVRPVRELQHALFDAQMRRREAEYRRHRSTNVQVLGTQELDDLLQDIMDGKIKNHEDLIGRTVNFMGHDIDVVAIIDPNTFQEAEAARDNHRGHGCSMDPEAAEHYRDPADLPEDFTPGQAPDYDDLTEQAAGQDAGELPSHNPSPLCTECGRDNDNGTHDELRRSGHLDHDFTAA